MPNNLIVNQKSVRDLFQDNKTDFLIPDYQRPYAWGKEECGTLWEDIFEFAIPDADATKFDDNKEEYWRQAKEPLCREFPILPAEDTRIPIQVPCVFCLLTHPYSEQLHPVAY